MEQTMEQTNEKKVLLAVAFDAVKNTYFVDIAKGSNVAETAFSISVIIKCLIKDGVIKNSNEITDLIDKYLTDPQYEELKEEDAENEN